MNRTSRALSRYVRRQISDAAEVRYGVYQMPHGLSRGVVRLGGCEQDVTAQRISNHEKGERVAVVGGTILPTPPALPGPSSRSAFKVGGTPYQAPPPPPGPQSGARAVIRDFTNGGIHLVRWENEVAVEVVASRSDLQGDFLGLGDRSAITRRFTGGGAAWMITRISLEDLSTLSEYTWVAPTPNPNLAEYQISDATLYNGRLYWVELENDEPGQTHTWELMSAAVGNVSSATLETSVEVDNSDIDTGTLVNLHFWAAGGRPFRVDTGWRFENNVRYGRDPFVQFFFKAVTVDFSVPSAVLGQVSGGVNPNSVALRDGNLGPLDVLTDTDPDPLAARISGASKTLSLVWPRPTAFGDIARASDQYGNTYHSTVSVFAGPQGTFEVRRGDITDPSPTLEVFPFGSPNAIMGSSNTRPELAWVGD